jgi:hypothetical protein
MVDAVEHSPQPQNLLVEPDLLPDIGDHQLEFGVTVIEEPLIVLDLSVDENVSIIERPQLCQVSHELFAHLNYIALLILSSLVLEV